MVDYRQTYFPNLRYRGYFNHAAISPLAAPVQAAMTAMIQTYAEHGMRGWTQGNHHRAAVRGHLSQMLGCAVGDIGLVANTTHAITAVAQEFPWQAGDGLVLIRGEFPANILAWLQAARDHHLEVFWLSLQDLADESPAFHKVMARRPKLMAVSWVQYQTGWTQDLAQLSSLRERFGLAVCVDAIQGLAALRLNLEQTPLDFVASGAHKWLLSPEGCGYLYVNPDWQAKLRPRLAGWLSQERPVDFLFEGGGHVDYQRAYRAEPTRYEWGTMSPYPYAGMDAALQMLLTVGLDKVATRIQDLARYTREQLAARAFPVLTDHCDAGIVSFPLAASALKSCVQTMDRAGFAVATPDGYLRIAPHFYNERAEIDALLEALTGWREGRKAPTNESFTGKC
ncbi:aminotransferase class V-fold PLP-dependent enzyme [Acanthopleuribacter pedis]|uniref:Aminotransferase class V-fold PLP-dependent enzyme n=1 Tax=Acanthopleuribacter pedis TaxID=442870 RepID=A0A8J7QBX6_9BACT|nr:aminotransferase class V-fold PLP-dependent enzyme [Acanthopleuribacter pedis]MBO1318161.1 aminotransferase class V-fold PLP-dependent enzyme [Acanthopleuribacter pedis]